MLGTEVSLALYYAGFGFVIFLVWATFAGKPQRATASPRRRVATAGPCASVAVSGLLLSMVTAA